MTKIFLKDKESTELIIKRFKNLILKSKILINYKERLFHKKPSVLKKYKNKLIIKNLQKLSRKRIILNKKLF